MFNLFGFLQYLMVYMVGYKICYIYVIYFDDCYFVYIESGMFLLEV